MYTPESKIAEQALNKARLARQEAAIKAIKEAQVLKLLKLINKA